MSVWTSWYRWLATALAALALVLGIGTATVGVASAPAHAAGGGFLLCLPVHDQNGNLVDWACVWISLTTEEVCPPCPDWGFSLDHLVNPADRWYVEDLVGGLGLLEQAALNPRRAEQLRAAAQEEFLSAARRLGETETRLGQAGSIDWELNVIRPDADPWLVAAGTDVGNGLTLMQQALAEPDPEPFLAAAMAEFEEAYQELAQQQPIGR